MSKEELKLDKIRAEIVDTLYVDSLIFGELIDFKNEKISADDVIEEFNRVTRSEVLKIIDKYKAECEVEVTPCDLCMYGPPSSGDGKPCTMCPACGRSEEE